MPAYDYVCNSCKRRVVIVQSYREYGNAPVLCPYCGSEDLKRLINRVLIARSEESRLDSLSDPSRWGNIDEEDPRAIARMMREMGKEMGEELPPEFDEAVDRLEAGQSPEEIEQSMPELGANIAEADE
jgi:putative FmdB family regulatory protein